MVIELKPEEITWLGKSYPNLSLEDGFLRGLVESYREYEGVALNSSFDLEIDLQTKEGSILPKVKETKGKIKNIAKRLGLPPVDLHINKDETICLCIYEKEKEYFPNRFSIKTFFENVLEPYLYWVSYYEKFKNPPWDGYAHYELGHLELYAENGISIDDLKNRIPLKKLLEYKKYKSHDKCLCRSKRKLKKCHKLVYKAIYKLKKELYE